MKARKRALAVLLVAVMLVSVIAQPLPAQAAKKKKASVSTAKKNYTVEVGKTAKIQVKSKNVKKFTSVKAKSSSKSTVKVTKVKKSKKKADVTVKALKAKSAKITITVKYTVAGKKKAQTKKLKVTVKGKAKAVSTPKVPNHTSKPSGKTPAPTTGGGVTATAAPTPQPTSETTPSPTATPTATPTAFATPRPTLRPTPEPVVANLVSVTNYKGTGNYAIEVTLDGEVDLSASDFAVTRKPYNSDQTSPVTGFDASRESARSYVLDFGREDVMWGDTLTVTVDSLTGTKKTGSVVKTGFGDGATETENYVVKAGTEYDFDYSSYNDNLYGEITYTSAEELPEGITIQEMEEQTDEETGLQYAWMQFSVAGTVPAGIYNITLDIEDKIGTKVTRVYNIMVVSESEILINQYKDTVVEEADGLIWAEIANVAGGVSEQCMGNPYSIEVEEIPGDMNSNLQWELREEMGTYVLSVSGWVGEERTYHVTVSVTDNPEITKTIQVTVKPGRKVKVSGTVRYMDNAPVDDLNPHVYCKKKENGKIYYPEDMDEGTYDFYLTEGTYACYAVFYILGKEYYFYRAENVVITAQTEPLQDIDIFCQIAAAQIDFTDFEDGASLKTMPDDFKENCTRRVVYPRGGWYDEKNNYLGGTRSLALLPGEYDLHCDEAVVYLSNETVSDQPYWYTGTAHVVVAPDKITVQAVYDRVELEDKVTAAMDMAAGSISFEAGWEEQIVKVIPTKTSGYEIYTCLADTPEEEDEWHDGDNIVICRADGYVLCGMDDMNINSASELLEAGKTYYIMVKERSGEACKLVVNAMEKRRISGQVRDAEGNALTFPGETIELTISIGDSIRTTTELKADGSYEADVYVGANTNEVFVCISLPGSGSGEWLSFDLTEDMVVDIKLCVITIQTPEEYKDCSIVYDEWRPEFEWFRLGWTGNVLYAVCAKEDWIDTDTATTKVTITDKQGNITTTNAFISYNNGANQTVTAEFKDWGPDPDTVTSITAGKPVAGDSTDCQWYSFIPEADGLYQVDITNSDDNWYNVYDRYGRYMEEENHTEEYTGEPLTYRMKAGEKYFIQVYPDGEYTLRVDKVNE